MKFISKITKELLQEVVVEQVRYYALSLKDTEVDDLYDEAVRKTWLPPVLLDALVKYDDAQQTSTGFGADQKLNIEAYFHYTELLERNLSPKQGDFLEYGRVVYEIASVTKPQIVYGQVNNPVMQMCKCVPSREGQFAIGGETETFVDRTSPLANSSGSLNRS